MTAPSLLQVLILASALGCGLIAGVFFAFSTFVMRALDRLPAPHAVAAMQSINIAVIHPLFLAPFFGTALTCVAAAMVARSHLNFPAISAAAALHLFGTLLVTILCNVPLNNRLEAADPSSPAAASAWRHYFSRWLFWNHVRTVAAAAASSALIYSLF